MSTTAKPATVTDLLRLSAEGERFELVRGELREMAPAGPTHGSLTLIVGSHLLQHVRLNKLGMACVDAGFQIATNPDTVRAPDVAFVSRDRVESVGAIEQGYWPGAPDLAIEVISPNDRYGDVDDKVADWLRAGARLVIVINPRRKCATLHRSPTDSVHLAEHETLDGGDVVPGWRLPLTELFETAN